jgi:predicted MFS family arabinose efflux permease
MWGAGLISDLGDAVGRVALTILVQESTGSALLTGSVVVMYSLPYLGPGQWITARIAHLSRRRVLIASDLLRAVCFALLVLPIGILPRLAIVLVASLATPPFAAVSGAVVARSVPDELLGHAAGLRTGTTELSFVVGFAVGGLVADLASPVWVLGFDALTFLVSALIIASLTADSDPSLGDRRHVRVGDGLRAITDDPWCRRIVALIAAAFALVLIPETLVATYADEVFPSLNGATGALAALAAAGVIVATLVTRPDDEEGLLRHASWIVVAGGALASLAFFGPADFALAGVAYLALGPVLAIRVHAYTVLSRRVDDAVLAPAMSVAGGVLAASYSVAGLAGGAIAEAIGPELTFALATALAAGVGAASLLLPVRAEVSRSARG